MAHKILGRDEVSQIYRRLLPHLKQNGSQWRCPCPLHQGKRESFAVDPDTGTWFCHQEGRGGSVFDLIKALDNLPVATGANTILEAGSLSPDGESAFPKQPTAPRRIAATYDYYDAQGSHCFQVVRQEPKGFFQRQHDGLDGWVNSLKAGWYVFRRGRWKQIEGALLGDN